MKPNILWICTDRQRWDTLGCFGNSFVTTPNLDALAASGTAFECAFSQNPICSPSRASFMTGRYPRTTRMVRNGQQLPADEKIVPRLLADAGYLCGHAGKLHLAPGAPPLAIGSERRRDDGFSVFDWSLHPPDIPSAYTAWLEERGIKFKREPVGDSPYVEIGMPAETSNTGWTAQRAIDFIRANSNGGRGVSPVDDFKNKKHRRDARATHTGSDACASENKQPWFFFCSIESPHNPFDPPREFLEPYLKRLDEIPLPRYTAGELDNKPPFQKSDRTGAWGGTGSGYFAAEKMSDRDHRMIRAAFWALCDHIDYEVGRIIAALRETGQLDNTLVLFMSDHGEMLGDHGIYFQGAYFYDEMIRVPLLFGGAKQLKHGVKSAALVELVDIAPTLLDAAGVERFAGMQGKSLWKILTGEADAQKHREDIYSEYYQSIPMAYKKVGEANATALRSKEFLFTVFHGREDGELYDLKKDPTQTVNRWSDAKYQEVKMRLLKRLADRMAGTVDPLPQTEAAY
jgi:arylsulfatase